MQMIIVFTDYKDVFGSKYDSLPYRAGMDKDLLKNHFEKNGFEIRFIKFSDVNNYDAHYWNGKYVLYTSSEDTGYYYKNFIEDIIYYLELNGAIVIPRYRYLKANNNKVFMELLRRTLPAEFGTGINSRVFGCLEEAKEFLDDIKYPVVFKQAAGAMSEGVGLGLSRNDLNTKLKKLAATSFFIEDIKDLLRPIKHKGYIKESRFRKKFILQDFIPELKGDFKVLIYSDKFYVLKRGVKQNDFRASGSGLRDFVKDLPEGLLDFSHKFFLSLNVPNASLDIGFNGTSFFLIEFQCIYFGSYTITFSDYFWRRTQNKFEMVEAKSLLEKEYVTSIVDFIRSL
jgi:glutathione synthase/RimK-type ligase-like ATP-grasp enzyme